MSDDWSLVALVDQQAARLQRLAEFYPQAKAFESLTELFASGTKVDLVAIATPVAAHHALCKQALEAGANVLCEKPLCSSVKEADELLALTDKQGLKLFVDHTFTYTGAVRKIRELYRSGALGELYYVDSARINLGLFQSDVDVIWDLAPHDISILTYVLGKKVVSVQATGSSHNPRNLADVAYLTLTFEGGVTAHLHLSWLSPVKLRRMIFAGTNRSVTFDDLELSEKLKIYDHGVTFDVLDAEARKQVLVNYRRGDMHAPAINNSEALGTQVKEIARVLRGENLPLPNGEDGRQIVQVCEAAGQSMRSGGVPVSIV